MHLVFSKNKNMTTSLTAVSYMLLLLAHNISYGSCSEKEQSGLWNALKNTAHEATKNEYLMYGAKTAAVAGAVVAGAPLVLSAAGFGAAGVVGGSLAAGFQASVLGGSATGLLGGTFATLQSIGTAGLGLGAKSAIVSVSAAVVKTFEAVTKSNREDDDEEK